MAKGATFRSFKHHTRVRTSICILVHAAIYELCKSPGGNGGGWGTIRLKMVHFQRKIGVAYY